LFAGCETVILMLRDEAATDAVLGRGTEDFARRVAGRRIVVMGTNSPGYSARLETELRAAGAAYVEAPVSGSRVPADHRPRRGALRGHRRIRVRRCGHGGGGAPLHLLRLRRASSALDTLGWWSRHSIKGSPARSAGAPRRCSRRRSG